ncbi:hypothetical protein SVIO_106350 [Streptomyces violaceusniger]|uniref:Uncharacterized protein n=1 Tax=Streptomyces violaceusniger TaxID=68280 RepID=A0A4D4LFF8_STRVO|nr:hypothetical protein SVIO_106350 [Streptomyces violaceusniger]
MGDVPGYAGADEREHLWGDQAAARALHQPGRDQPSGAGGGGAGHRADREHRGAQHEQPPVTVAVAQPCCGDEQARVRQGVSGQDELHRTGAHAQAGLDGRSGDLRDRDVEQLREGGTQHHRQQEPTAVHRTRASASARCVAAHCHEPCQAPWTRTKTVSFTSVFREDVMAPIPVGDGSAIH